MVSDMGYVNELSFSWISGLMFGIEFLFEDDEEQTPEDKCIFKFGMAIDLGIVRILYQRFAIIKE